MKRKEKIIMRERFWMTLTCLCIVFGVLSAKAEDTVADKILQYFPQADTNKDGTLSWPEFKTHKAKVDALKNQSKK